MRNFIAKLLIKSIAPRIKVNLYSADNTCYLTEKKTIKLNLQEVYHEGGAEGARVFLQHLAQVHKCSFVNEFPIELWTTLHEIGHHFTLDDFDEEVDYKARCALSNANLADYADPTDFAFQYFNLRSEWIATEWAINYIKKHPIKCLIFGDLLR